MPLSSLSGPSLGSAGSASAIIALASSCRAANEAESVLPKSAGGRARKIRPKGPSNKRELRDRFAPRTLPCAPATRGAFINTPCAERLLYRPSSLGEEDKDRPQAAIARGAAVAWIQPS